VTRAEEYLDARLRGIRRRVCMNGLAARSLAVPCIESAAVFCRTRAFACQSSRLIRAMGRDLVAANGIIDELAKSFLLNGPKLAAAMRMKMSGRAACDGRGAKVRSGSSDDRVGRAPRVVTHGSCGRGGELAGQAGYRLPITGGEWQDGAEGYAVSLRDR